MSSYLVCVGAFGCSAVCALRSDVPILLPCRAMSVPSLMCDWCMCQDIRYPSCIARALQHQVLPKVFPDRIDSRRRGVAQGIRGE
eukprot:12282430-Alexandrium_andersonii.AAC.1